MRIGVVMAKSNAATLNWEAAHDIGACKLMLAVVNLRNRRPNSSEFSANLLEGFTNAIATFTRTIRPPSWHAFETQDCQNPEIPGFSAVEGVFASLPFAMARDSHLSNQSARGCWLLPQTAGRPCVFESPQSGVDEVSRASSTPHFFAPPIRPAFC